MPKSHDANKISYRFLFWTGLTTWLTLAFFKDFINQFITLILDLFH
ncbi:hypothetical protein [Lacticaseibacillus saniviri]